MTSQSQRFFFRSDLFLIDPKEDEETNPFCYGKSLAEWLRIKFEKFGYQPEPVIAEDWGWCLMLRREPFMLWVGCGNDRSEFYDKVTPEQKESFAPNGKEILWCCFVGSDAPIWTSFFWKKLIGLASTHEQVGIATDQLQSILRNEPRIQITAEPAA